MFCLSPVLTYEVYILTGDKLGAGTKAAVKLTIFGEYGNSGERQLLRSRTHRSKFQRGQVGRSRIGAKNRNPHIFVLDVCCIFTKIIYFTSRGPFNKVLYGDVPSRTPTAYIFYILPFLAEKVSRPLAYLPLKNGTNFNSSPCLIRMNQNGKSSCQLTSIAI